MENYILSTSHSESVDFVFKRKQKQKVRCPFFNVRFMWSKLFEAIPRAFTHTGICCVEKLSNVELYASQHDTVTTRRSEDI